MPEHIPEELSGPSKQRRKAKCHQQQQQFLKGPIPLNWLAAAASLPGKSLAVAVALWYQAGLTKSREGLAVTPRLLRRFGINRYAGYRGLGLLELAGLVSVDRHRGRCPRVAILRATRPTTDSTSARQAGQTT
jgi:hypothetical protein